MQHLETDTSSLGPWWGKEEKTMFVHVPLMIGTGVFHNLRILASEDNPASCDQASSNGNMSSSLAG